MSDLGPEDLRRLADRMRPNYPDEVRALERTAQAWQQDREQLLRIDRAMERWQRGDGSPHEIQNAIRAALEGRK